MFLFFVGCLAVVVLCLVVFSGQSSHRKNLVYSDLVWIRKTATVVTVSAAIGQKKRSYVPAWCA